MTSDRSSLHVSHFPYLKFDNTPQMWWLNGLRISRELAAKLVLFFLPLFLFQQGQSLSFWPDQFSSLQRGVMWLALFFLVRNVVALITAIPSAQLISKIGPQRAIELSQLGFMMQFWLLLIGKDQAIWLVLAAAVLDGTQNLFWSSYFTLLSQNAVKTRFGADVGLINFLLHLVVLLAPILGGWLIMWQGFGALFLVGIVCVLVGMILALKLNVSEAKDRVSWTEFFSWLHERSYQKLAFSYVGRYSNDAALSIWPLYVFLLVGSVQEVGYLYSLALFLAMIVTYITAAGLDKLHNRRPFVFSGGLLSLLWLMRTQIGSIWSIVMIDTCDRLTASFHWLFFDKQFLVRSKGREALSFFAYREVIIGLAAVGFWLGFILIFGLFGWPLKAVFVVAAIGVWLSLLVREHKTE